MTWWCSCINNSDEMKQWPLSCGLVLCTTAYYSRGMLPRTCNKVRLLLQLTQAGTVFITRGDVHTFTIPLLSCQVSESRIDSRADTSRQRRHFPVNPPVLLLCDGTFHVQTVLFVRSPVNVLLLYFSLNVFPVVPPAPSMTSSCIITSGSPRST